MATPPEENPLQLLLADGEDYHPALEGGLPSGTVEGAKTRKLDRTIDIRNQDKPDGDPNDLPAQRWGIIAPKDREGKRLLDRVAPLIALRASEQGAQPKVYEVEPGMSAADAKRFRDDVYHRDVPEDERPRYLLILGDLDKVSYDLQRVLVSCSFVGRLAFTDAAGDVDLGAYAAYAEKIVARSKSPSLYDAPDACFFTANDGTPATALARARLVGPSVAEAERLRRSDKLNAASVVDPGESADDLLRAAASSRPAVLLSASHGLGAPRGGWRSLEQQRSLQGALALGGKDVLRASDLVGKRFLPGGMWFCLACFGAGTPASSVYYTWLSELAKTSAYEGRLDAVLHSLPSSGQSPFIAALPQAALANPEGPLAVIGHVDLAWTYAFTGGRNFSESSSGKIFSTIKALVNGSRAGVALDALMRHYRDAATDLNEYYQNEAAAGTQRQVNPANLTTRAHLWMLSHDLRDYMLLGDPAARLPLKSQASAPKAAPSPPEIRPAPPPETTAPVAPVAPVSVVVPASAPNDAPSDRREAVLAVLRGESRTEIAAWYGVSLSELKRWVDTFVSAGSLALDRLDRA